MFAGETQRQHPECRSSAPWQVGIIDGAAVHGANLHRHGLALLIKLVRYGAVRCGTVCGTPVTVGGWRWGKQMPRSLAARALGRNQSHYNRSLGL